MTIGYRRPMSPTWSRLHRARPMQRFALRRCIPAVFEPWSVAGFNYRATSVERALAYLETLDCVPFRGLIRGSALASTSGLLLSDFDPFDSCGTEMRLMAQLALWGEFRFVPGPVYYKRLHGANLHLKRQNWSEHQKQLAWASLAAWMIEVVAPAGRDPEERRRLFDIVLARFLVPNDPWKWVRAPARRLASTSFQGTWSASCPARSAQSIASEF